MAAKLFVSYIILSLINLFAVFYISKKFNIRKIILILYFLAGGIGTAPFIALRYFGILTNRTFSFLGIGVYVLFAFLEEADKSIFFCGRRTRPISLFIAAGLGFAYVENLFYFYNSAFFVSFTVIVVFRIFLSTPAHALFTGSLGCIFEANIFKRRKIIGYMSGMLFAVIFHSAFNIFQHFNLAYLAVPLLVGNYYLLKTMKLKWAVE